MHCMGERACAAPRQLGFRALLRPSRPAAIAAAAGASRRAVGGERPGVDEAASLRAGPLALGSLVAAEVPTPFPRAPGSVGPSAGRSL